MARRTDEFNVHTLKDRRDAVLCCSGVLQLQALDMAAYKRASPTAGLGHLLRSS